VDPALRECLHQILVDAALATLFAVIGLLSLAAGLRWRAGRAPGLVLGAALIQHSVNRLAASVAVRAALGGPLPLWIWVGNVTGYLIAVPWALLLELVVGPGWKSSIRRTWQVFLVYGLGAVLVDVVSGRPGAAGGSSQAALVAVGALVGLANVLGGARIAPELGVMRAGYLVFLALVVHDGLVFLGFLPWRTVSNPFGLLIFVGCLVYTVVTRTLRGQRQLQAIEHEGGRPVAYRRPCCRRRHRVSKERPSRSVTSPPRRLRAIFSSSWTPARAGLGCWWPTSPATASPPPSSPPW
jgi:hypothetical protein